MRRWREGDWWMEEGGVVSEEMEGRRLVDGIYVLVL